MKKWILIVNPSAGRGKGAAMADRLENRLKTDGFKYERLDTNGPGDAVIFARGIDRESVDKVMIVSGDGTVNEVLRGLSHPAPPIAVFPAGTGNDVARMLGIKNEAHAYETAVGGVVRSVDIGMASGEPFLNIFSFGFDAAIATQANKWKHKFPGWFLYPAALIKTIFTYESPDVRISINGESLNKRTPAQKILLLAVCNGGYYGGGMNINPLADPFDGKLELCIIKPMPRLKILLLFPTIYSGRHMRFKEVSITRISQVAFSSESTLLLNNDGETRPGNESDITLSTQGIPMMCPQNME